jgi:hypothetical protein
MTDFADEVRRRIQAAMDSQAKHQSELDARLRAEKQRRQELAERSEQAGLLITQRFEEAVKASSGMLNYTAPEGWKKKNEREEASKTYELGWKGPGPQRTLAVSLYANGVVHMSVLAVNRPVSESRAGISVSFEAQLEHAVFDFIDQEAWHSHVRSDLGLGPSE